MGTFHHKVFVGTKFSPIYCISRFYEFSLRYRRVQGESNIKNISEELLRIKC